MRKIRLKFLLLQNVYVKVHVIRGFVFHGNFAVFIQPEKQYKKYLKKLITRLNEKINMQCITIGRVFVMDKRQCKLNINNMWNGKSYIIQKYYAVHVGKKRNDKILRNKIFYFRSVDYNSQSYCLIL